MERIYGYYCPVAHALGAVGERWSLLIVRDLLNGPRRFTDLSTRLGNITPKWLTQRLRQLEEAGVVRRINGEDRREKWYQLTRAGEELQPVIDALKTWGLNHAMRPPLTGEVVHPDLALGTLKDALNRRNKKLYRPADWLFKFTTGTNLTLSFDGSVWKVLEGEAESPQVILAISPEAWTTFLTVRKDERKNLSKNFVITGDMERVAEFFQTFGVSE